MLVYLIKLKILIGPLACLFIFSSSDTDISPVTVEMISYYLLQQYRQFAWTGTFDEAQIIGIESHVVQRICAMEEQILGAWQAIQSWSIGDLSLLPAAAAA